MDWVMKNRISRILKPATGRTVMLAIDHGYFLGPTSGLEKPYETVEPLLPYADSLMLTRGILRRCIPPTSSIPIVLRISGGTSILKELSNEGLTVAVEDAIRRAEEALEGIVADEEIALAEAAIAKAVAKLAHRRRIPLVVDATLDLGTVIIGGTAMSGGKGGVLKSFFAVLTLDVLYNGIILFGLWGERYWLVAPSLMDSYSGMAEVYLARDTQLGRKVALKVLHERTLTRPDDVERFLFEARATARFNHPHIVKMFDLARLYGDICIAMEYVAGENLDMTSDSRPAASGRHTTE